MFHMFLMTCFFRPVYYTIFGKRTVFHLRVFRIINWKPLTIITKSSILDVAAALMLKESVTFSFLVQVFSAEDQLPPRKSAYIN